MAATLDDDEALARLRLAADTLGVEPGETVRGNTALEAARRAVMFMTLGLEIAIEQATDTVPGVITPPPEPEPGSDSPDQSADTA